MAIVPLFRHAAFDPEALQATGVAFDMACKRLTETLLSELNQEMVAAAIIEYARRGERRREVLLQHAFRSIQAWEGRSMLGQLRIWKGGEFQSWAGG